MLPFCGALVLLIASQADAAAAEPLGGLLGPEASEPLTGVTVAVTDSLQPVADAADPLVAPVADAVGPVTAPVVRTLDPALDPVAPILDPIQPLLDPVEPLLEPVEPLLDPVERVLPRNAPILEPAPTLSSVPALDAEARSAAAMITLIDETAVPIAPTQNAGSGEASRVAIDLVTDGAAKPSEPSIVPVEQGSLGRPSTARPIGVMSSVPASAGSIGSDGAAGSFAAMAIGLLLAVLLGSTALAVADWPTPMGLQLTPPVPPA